MTSKPNDLPLDLASAYQGLLAEREARLQVEAERDIAVAGAANAQAQLSDRGALIAHLELRIEKLKREIYGPRPERPARLIDQPIGAETRGVRLRGEQGRACCDRRDGEDPDRPSLHAQAAGAQALARRY